VPDAGLPPRAGPVITCLGDLDIKGARSLLWYARLNMGSLVNLAWWEYCEDRRAPLSPEAHNRSDIVHFLSTVVWSTGVPEEEPTLTGVRDTGSISPDWDRGAALAGLAQTRCIIWLLEGNGQWFLQKSDVDVATRWQNFSQQNNLEHLVLGLISHEDSLEFLRSLGRVAGADSLDSILARALADGMQVIAPRTFHPKSKATGGTRRMPSRSPLMAKRRSWQATRTWQRQDLRRS